MNLFGLLVGLLERGISQTQGLYLHRITQHWKKVDTCLERDTNSRYSCSRGRRRYVHWTARPLVSAWIPH